jgi:hypothetical protein
MGRQMAGMALAIATVAVVIGGSAEHGNARDALPAASVASECIECFDCTDMPDYIVPSIGGDHPTEWSGFQYYCNSNPVHHEGGCEATTPCFRSAMAAAELKQAVEREDIHRLGLMLAEETDLYSVDPMNSGVAVMRCDGQSVGWHVQIPAHLWPSSALQHGANPASMPARADFAN